MENYIEQCKAVRKLTMAPMKDIAAALIDTKGDVDAAVQLLIKNKAADAADMANRKADNNIVYSYVHNNKVGAMIVLACQTDFVARNEMFLKLAREISMHIVSNTTCEYVSESDINQCALNMMRREIESHVTGKPLPIINKIVDGKLNKKLDDICLLRQKFVKDDTITIQQLIANVSATMGEKIEVKKFVRFSA
jgi:elongation factor Ts